MGLTLDGRCVLRTNQNLYLSITVQKLLHISIVPCRYCRPCGYEWAMSIGFWYHDMPVQACTFTLCSNVIFRSFPFRIFHCFSIGINEYLNAWKLKNMQFVARTQCSLGPPPIYVFLNVWISTRKNAIRIAIVSMHNISLAHSAEWAWAYILQFQEVKSVFRSHTRGTIFAEPPVSTFVCSRYLW